MTTPPTAAPPAPAPLPMTPGRRLALALGLPLALLVIGWGALSLVAWAGQASYPVRLDLLPHGRRLSLAVDSGQVSVTPAARQLIRVRGTARYALVRSRVSWHRTAAGVTLQSQCRQLTGPCSFDYRVAMPAGLAADITIRSGGLSVRGLRGQVTLRADAGDLHVAALSGAVQLSDLSGTITADSLTGPSVAAGNQSGDITLTGVSSQRVTVTDRSGDITVRFTAVPTRVQVTALSGDVRLVLPPGRATYRVSAHTSSGQTVIGVPVDPVSRHLITVTDKSGDITVTR